MAYNPKAEKFIQNLTQFFNLKGMGHAYRDGLDALYKKGIATSEQNKWKPYLEDIKNGTTPEDLQFSKLDESDQKVVYNWIQDMLFSMSMDDRLMNENSAAKDFVDKYYGDPIEKYSVTPIDDTYAKEIGESINNNSSTYADTLGLEKKALEKLSKTLLDGSYASNPEALQTFNGFLNAIRQIPYLLNDPSNTKAKTALKQLPDCLKTYDNIFADKSDATSLGKYIEKNTSKLTCAPFSLDETKLNTLAEHLKKGNSSDAYLSDVLKKLAEHPIETPHGLPEFLQPQDYLDQTERDSIAKYLKDNAKELNTATGIDIVNFNTVAKALQNNTYRTNSDEATKFEDILGKISNLSQDKIPTTSLPDMFMSSPGEPSPEGFKNLLKQVQIHINTEAANWYSSQQSTNINNKNVEEFQKNINTRKELSITDATKLDEPIREMFETLTSNKKVHDAAVSRQNDIQQHFNKGLADTDYKSGEKTKVKPVYADKKTLFNRACDNIKSYYNDTLGKLEQKHKRHVYQTKANYIVDSLIKKGVKPSDGAGKLLDTLTSIQGSLDGVVASHAKWAVETLSELKDKEIFKNSLRNGTQMNELVSEIIVKAAETGKVEEAMTTLEMLSVMRYTSTTSSVRDELKKMDFTIFGDPNTSFNKDNKFIHSFMKGIDVALKYGMLAAFEVANFAKNKINQRGLKFKKGEKTLNERITKTEAYKQNDKRAIMEKLFGFWNFVNDSGKSKDYNIFVKHSNVQKKADEENTGSIQVNLAGKDKPMDYKTEREKKFYEYLRDNNYGRAA